MQRHFYFLFLHVWYLQSHIRWQITNIKRKTCIGIRPIDSLLYFVNSSSPMSCLICDDLRSTCYCENILYKFNLLVILDLCGTSGCQPSYDGPEQQAITYKQFCLGWCCCFWYVFDIGQNMCLVIEIHQEDLGLEFKH
jgi:hypothetical protein